MSDTNEPAWKTNPRCDDDQLAMLRRCSAATNMAEWNDWHTANREVEVWLQGADLSGAHLQGADLRKAHLEGADLTDAHFEGARFFDAHLEGAELDGSYLGGANLWYVHLEKAKLYEAHLEGASLYNAHLEGVTIAKSHLNDTALHSIHLEDASVSETHLERALIRCAHLEGTQIYRVHLESAWFSFAIVDGATLFSECTVNRETDFTGVGLGACRIDPGLKQTLEYNIRRKGWGEWYGDGPKWQWPFRRAVQLFWAASDYGHHTWPIAAAFVVLSVLFAAFYRFLPGLVVCKDGQPLAGLWHAIYFSVVTMTTLGFGDIHASRGSALGQFLLMFQVILGYVLLGALVCRLAILFQADGPAAKFSKHASASRSMPPDAEAKKEL